MNDPERSDVPRTAALAGALADSLAEAGLVYPPLITDKIRKAAKGLSDRGYILEIEAQASRDAEVTVTGLREALDTVVRFAACWEADVDTFVGAGTATRIRTALTDSSSMAQAYRERLVAPWREALDHRTNRHLHFETTCDGCQSARSLLDPPEGSER